MDFKSGLREKPELIKVYEKISRGIWSYKGFFELIDDGVITGSYNFSRSAQFNSENILFIESAPFAEAYSAYIDHLKQKYEMVGQALN